MMKKQAIRPFVTFFMSILLFLCLLGNVSYAETLEENLNNLVGPKVQYNTMLSPVYLKNNTIEEHINPQSGSLSIAQTDYVLPGRNGLDLEIKRLYSSDYSNVKEMNTQYYFGAWVDTVYSDVNTSSFIEDRYNLGIGIRFSFPSMEVKKNTDGTTHIFLHSESGDVYSLKQKSTQDEVKTYIPENQTIEDVVITEDTGFSNSQSDGTSKFKMVGKDGKKTYFSDDGRVIGIVDRYDNTIKFEYITQRYTIDGTTKSKKLISKIIDSVGREVTISYNEDYSFKVTPIKNQNYSLENSYTASQNPNTQDSGDLQGKFQVVISLPDGKKIIYDKTASLVSNSKQVIRTRLQRVYDVDGKVKYHFWYEQPDLGFTFMNGVKYTAFNRYENLTQVDYCKENRLVHYTYSMFTKKLNGNSGSMQYRKIVEKKELAKTSFDDTKTNFTDKFQTNLKAYESYKYINESDGFGTNEYKGDDKEYLKDSFRYYTEKTIFAENTDDKSVKTKYTYNGIHETIEQTEEGSDHKKVTVTEYDEMRFPKKVQVSMTNMVDGKPIGQPSIKIENFRYDKCGNLTNYVGPLAKRDEKGYPAEDDPHMVVYTYDYERFHVLTLKTWRQDEDTICQTRFIPDDKGNIIREEKLHIGNTVDYIIIDYKYDIYGNMIQKSVRSPEQDYVTCYEYGVDLNGVDQKGVFLTKEYSVLDGVEIANQYAYDPNTGNILIKTDGKGNRIGYEYDLLGRLTKVINPDGTSKQYLYKEFPIANTQLEYVDAQGFVRRYEFDTLGRQVKESLYDEGVWRTYLTVEYDFRGNKLKEIDANGHSARFTYDSADRLVKKEFYEKDTVRKENITLSYTFTSGEEASTIVTQKDEAGYLQKFHYDILNRLSKYEISPLKDNSVFYVTIYKYDFIGNMTTITDAEGNTTCYEYDNLGRLIKKTDALNNEICYFYNSLDKLTFTEEPNGRVIQYIYDAFGRMIEERTIEKGSADYIYTRYAYDKAGNVEVKKEGSVASGIDTPSFEMRFSYNSMNLPVDTYQKLDNTRVRHTHYVYDSNGNRIEVIEYVNKEEDQYIHSLFEYNYAGNVIKEEGYLSFENSRQGYFLTTYIRDYAGNVLFEHRLNQGKQEITSYIYDYRNRLKTKTEPYKNGKYKTTLYEYDEKGNMISETVARVVNGQEVNSTTTYTYDGRGKKLSKANALGYTTTYVYDKNGNLIKEIDPRYFGKPINAAPGLEYEYDALNRLIKSIAFDGTTRKVISYKEYDGRSNLVLEANGEGYNPSNPSASIGSRYQYDAANRVIIYSSAQAYFDGSYSKKSVYDGSGRLIKEEDGNNNVTQYSYFLDGSLKELAFADGSTEKYGYDLSAKVFAIKYDRNGNRTVTFLNVFGKPFRIEYPDGTVETFEYDNKGNLMVSRDRAGNLKYFEYDASGNLLSKREFVLSDGNHDYYKQTVYSYDQANSILLQETFELKIKRQDGTQVYALPMNDRIDYFYDKAGRQVNVKGPEGRETRNTYNAADNLILKEDRVTAEGEFDATAYTYDTQSRVLTKEIYVKTEDIDLSTVSKIFMGEGAYSSRIRSITSYEYYTDNKIKSLKDPVGNITRYEYDYDGRLIKKTDTYNKSSIYIYDVMGNLIEQIDERGISVFFEYDNVNRLIRKRTPSSDGEYAVTRYVYDSMGNLIKEISPNQYDASRDTNALVNTMVGMSFTYDVMARRISVVSPEGQIIMIVGYDNNGNVIKAVDGLRYTGNIDTSLGTTYEYDGLGRIIKQTDTLNNSTIYTYDVLGRLLKQTDARGNSTNFEYNPDGTLLKVCFADEGTIEYGYDKIGRKVWEKDQRGNEIRYAYNALGKLKSQTDPYGKSIENKYDINGNLVYQKDKQGSITYFTYDANNRLTEKKVQLSKDASGNFTYSLERYAYDEKGNITKKTLTGTKNKTSLRETYFTYYDNGLVKTVSDSVGAYQKSYYDKNGNLVKLEIIRDDENYDILKYRYDTMNRMIQNIKLVDRKTIFNGNGLPNAYHLTDTEHPDKICLITGYEYDILGNKTKEIDARGYGDISKKEEFATSYGYDALSRLNTTSRSVNGQVVTVQYFYDEVGNKIREIEERGYEKVYSYDNMNRLIIMTDALNNPYTYNYDKAGNKVSETNALGYSMTYKYDKMNRLETVTDPYGIVIINNDYDANGNIIKETDAKGNSEIRTYDLANRLLRVFDREGGETIYEYNQYGEKVREIDGIGNETAYEYDDGGRLVKVIDANKVSTRYSWDKAGNKLTMTDGRGKVTTYTYGGFGLLTSVTDAERNTITYQYDLTGNMEFQIDKNGSHTLFNYDNRNLLLSKEVLETGDSIGYTYDESGNRLSMTDDSGTSYYLYDGNNQLLKIEKENITQISYTYDRIGNISTVIDSKGFVTAYTYDKSSRMETVSFGGRTLVYSYDVNGNRESLTCEGSFSETYTVDKNNRVTGVYNRKPDGSIISQYTYTYDRAGRQTSKTDSYGTTIYTYDKVGRVIKVEMPGKTTAYTYDLAGNRASQSETYISAQPTEYIDMDSGKAVEYVQKKSDYVYSDSNRLLKLVERMYGDKNQEILRKTVQYYYDGNGNNLSETASYIHPHKYKLRQVTKGSIYSEDIQNPIDPLIERVNNTFDGFNRLKSVESIKGGIRTLTEYTYDGNDLRVEKVVRSSDNAYLSEITFFLYDRQHVILETDGTDDVKVRYIRGINYIGQYNNGSDISYYLYNGHGDTVQTVAKNGEVQNQYDYDIFGNPTLTVEISVCAIRYAGEYLDNETGLYYLRARYYDPYIGRFISEDSYWGEDTNPLSLNLYTYCLNNPIMYTDPTGHKVLNKGMKDSGDSKDIENLQILLRDLKYYTGEIDGSFGGQTKKAVEELQRDLTKLGLYNKDIDGIFGGGTQQGLADMLAGKQETVYTHNANLEPQKANSIIPPIETTQKPSNKVTGADTAVEKLVSKLTWPVPSTPDPMTGRPFSLDSVQSPETGEWKPHLGTDIKGEKGADVLAATKGTVADVGFTESKGNYIYINSVVGGINIQTRYIHLNKKAIPKVGEEVKAGQLIGYVGNTGASEGPHLHFEIWISTDNKPVNIDAWRKNYYNGFPVDPARVYPNNKVRADEWR